MTVRHHTSTRFRIGQVVLVKVDTADLPLLGSIGNRAWSVSHNGGPNSYAYVVIDQFKVFMHRLLCDFPQGLEVDHRNGDGLDNRRINLQPCTRQQNAAKMRISDKPSKRSKSGIRGISLLPSGRYSVKSMSKFIGSYDTLDEAKAVYNALRRAENIRRTGVESCGG